MTAWNIRIPTPAVDRVAGQHDGHQQRADRRRAAQHAESPRPGVQDVARIDRQQRRRAAQQHGEQVERYRAQYRWIAAHEADAGEQGGQRRRFFRRSPAGPSLIAPFSIAASNQNTAITA